MDMLTIDFETYYDQEYSLSKLSTEAYIRDSRFEVIGVGVKVNEEEITRWYEEVEFRALVEKTDFSRLAILAHHTHFDGAILAWHYGVRPKVWLDTLSMARAVVGGMTTSFSLDSLAKQFELGQKGREVIAAKGKRRSDFPLGEWKQYGEYCKNDVNLTRGLFALLGTGQYGVFDRQIPVFPKEELKLIDMHVRMFTEPTILLDSLLLKATLADTRYLKEQALATAGVDKADLMSNPRFAEVLKSFGVDPPLKISPTTGKETYAFAKTDAGMQALADHPDPQVQAIVAARMQNKSTIMETRLAKLIDVAARGPLPVYLKYAGADQTFRSSGGDGNNMQNNPRGSALRKAMLAPPGYTWVVVDSANIEARVLNALAGQQSTIEVFRKNDRKEGPDVYCIMASRLYGREITTEDKKERQHGKVVVLGCGYGMGGPKFKETARDMRVQLTEEEAQQSVVAYRDLHPMVVALWKQCDQLIGAMLRGITMRLAPTNLIYTIRDGLMLPNGLVIKYPNLRRENDEWVYSSGRMEHTKLYGGKIVENICQALARNIVMEQTLAVAKRYPLALSVHDEGVFCVPSETAADVLKYAVQQFATSPSWWPGIPLNAAGDIHESYGEAK